MDLMDFMGFFFVVVIVSLCVICIHIYAQWVRVPLGYSSFVYVHSIANCESFRSFFFSFGSLFWWKYFDIQEFDRLLWSVKPWKWSLCPQHPIQNPMRTLTLIIANFKRSEGERKKKHTPQISIDRMCIEIMNLVINLFWFN